MSISIVFPAYDEERKISSDIHRAAEFLREYELEGEIIVVDDGSNDKTSQIAKSLIGELDCELSLIRHERNLGKGFTVKTGVLKAKHDLILYSDAGDIVPFKDALKGIAELKNKAADIAHGSRKLPDSIIIKQQDPDRKLASWLFNTFLKGYLGIPKELTDTQCGFKVYKNEVGKTLYSNLQTSGFLFEIEIILRAKEKNYKIIEFPLEWKCDRDSRIRMWNTTPEILREIRYIKKMFD